MTPRDVLHRLNLAGRLMWEDFAHEETAEWFVAVLGGRAVDLSSPVDVAMLLTLLREATGDPAAHIVPDGAIWFVCSSKPLHAGLPGNGATEGEAIASALAALAAEVSP